MLAGRAIPLFATGYAICFGILPGMACHFYNKEWDGIVLQAVLATLSVFTATLLLYMTGVIKVTNKFVMGVGIAVGAPKIMEWYAAYGLMLSIIWMFVSILRLLALLRIASR